MKSKVLLVLLCGLLFLLPLVSACDSVSSPESQMAPGPSTLAELQKSRSLRYIHSISATWTTKRVITDSVSGTRTHGPDTSTSETKYALDFSNISWTGTSFSGQYGSPDNRDAGLWTIKGTVSSDGSEIASVTLTYKVDVKGYKEDASYQLSHLPLKVVKGHQGIAYVEGTGLQKYITSASYRRTETGPVYPNGSQTDEQAITSLKWDNAQNKAGITFWIALK